MYVGSLFSCPFSCSCSGLHLGMIYFFTPYSFELKLLDAITGQIAQKTSLRRLRLTNPQRGRLRLD